MGTSQLDRLMHLVEAPDRELDLAEAALLIAREEFPELDVRSYLARIARLATEVCRRLPREAGAGDTVFAMNEVLFDEAGFQGSSDAHDPQNSFLNVLLDGNGGGPVSLAILYIVVGRCVGLPLQGVALPQHVLVKFPLNDGSVILDPFAGGTCVDDLTLRVVLSRNYGEDVPEERVPALTAPASKREIMVHMLRQLENDYLHQARYDKALWTVDLLLRVAPEHTEGLRERGFLYECVQHVGGALADYRRYLELTPHANDAAEVKRRVARLKTKGCHLH